MASLAGGLMALVLGYNGPDATLSFSLMIDILLMIVIGGMGTLYGAVVGSIVVVLAEYYLQNALDAMSGAIAGMPLMSALFHPDRWLLWLGILFVLIVTFLPQGIVGRLAATPVARGVISHLLASPDRHQVQAITACGTAIGLELQGGLIVQCIPQLRIAAAISGANR